MVLAGKASLFRCVRITMLEDREQFQVRKDLLARERPSENNVIVSNEVVAFLTAH